ncbi:hypothetical protein MUG91_G15n14 [Manis pentadactyla]|nr:hypothetical protein MUG91_G15n14 [Manis pentadactyla]
MRECCYSECNLQALHSKSHLPTEQRQSSVAMVVEAWTPWMVSRWRRSKGYLFCPLLSNCKISFGANICILGQIN